VKPIAALLLGLVVAIVALDWLCGLGLPPPVTILQASEDSGGFRLRPYLDIPFEGYSVRTQPVRLLTDGEGFRIGPNDVEIGAPYETFIFGDEFILGEGLEAGDTYPARFEAKYREIYREELKVRNASVPGYGLRESVERVISALASKHKPFDWFLFIAANDLGGADSAASWKSPLHSRLLLRFGRIRDSWTKSSPQMSAKNIGDLAFRLGEAAGPRRGSASCVIAVIPDSGAPVRAADLLASAAGCVRQDVGRQLAEDPVSYYQEGSRLLSAEGAKFLALKSIIPLSATFQRSRSNTARPSVDNPQ